MLHVKPYVATALTISYTYNVIAIARVASYVSLSNEVIGFRKRILSVWL